MTTIYRPEEPYKSYHKNGMLLEQNVGEVITKRLKKWIEMGMVEVVGNDTHDMDKYISQRGGVDHIITVGNRRFEIEDKNCKRYRTPQSTAWGELEIFSRHSSGSDKYVITTYEDGVFSESLKTELENRGIKTLYVGHKVVQWYDNKVRAYLHRMLTPLFKKIENLCKLKQKREELKSLRMKGQKDTDKDSKSDVRSLLDYIDYTKYNGVRYVVSTVCVNGIYVWRVESDGIYTKKPESMRVTRKNTTWEGLVG